MKVFDKKIPNSYVDMMFQVYETKLNNVINSLNVVTNNNQHDLVIILHIESMTEKVEQGIKWLLTTSKGVNQFPRFTKNVQQDSTKVASLKSDVERIL